MEASAQDRTGLLHVVEQAAKIRMIWEEVATTHCCRPSEDVEAAYTAAASRWNVSLDERTLTLSSMWIGGSAYWE
ncbi:hypothetical protein ACFYNW_34955 [Streptomyces virginiae]|uniref:hypothetical protein n=1 Tax=Streptomyces virginiae TaxID=1961 RepID=UPI0036E80BBE